MAWSESLLDCSFRGFVFDVIKTEDSAEHATAEHTYPYLDGSDVEDLGLNGRRGSVEAIFWDGLASQDTEAAAQVSGYESRLQDFLKILDKRGPGELIHPIFGSMLVQILRYSVRHEADDVDQCRVHVEFVETTGADQPFFERRLASQQVDVISYQGGIARTALGEALADVIDTLRNASPLAALNSLRQQMLGPILATISDVQGVLISGLDVLNFPRAWAYDIGSIVDGILDLYDFGDKLLYDWSSAGKLFDRIDVFSHSSASSTTGNGQVVPGGAASSTAGAVPQIVPNATPTEAQAVAVVMAYLAATTAIGVADATALVLAAEADPQHGPTLSPPEIESVVDSARTRIVAALAAVRAIFPLESARAITEPMKDQALALQEAARAIIEARPPLIQKNVDAPGNLRLLAHRWYGDHTRAPELARLNPSLRSPNALKFGDALNAYAV